MTVTTHIQGSKYEISVETDNQNTAKDLLDFIQELKEKEKQERKCAENQRLD